MSEKSRCNVRSPLGKEIDMDKQSINELVMKIAQEPPLIANIPYFDRKVSNYDMQVRQWLKIGKTGEESEERYKKNNSEKQDGNNVEYGYFLHRNGQDFVKGDRQGGEIILNHPVVYIVYYHNKEDEKTWTVYVGETNNIVERTVQHVNNVAVRGEIENDSLVDRVNREKEEAADDAISKAIDSGIKVRQFVIWHPLFNKSLTLDIENHLIDYVQSLDNVHCLNGRSNAQKNYFTDNALSTVISEIWKRLVFANKRIQRETFGVGEKGGPKNPVLFPPEEQIWQSSLYKISPFHSLGDDQRKALEELEKRILEALREEQSSSKAKLFFVQGGAGTGKSILLSTLFYDLCQKQIDDTSDRSFSVKLLVRNNELLTQYIEMARLQGILTSKDTRDEYNVLNPTKFINNHTNFNNNRTESDQSKKDVDVVLIDEAHLLFTEHNQSYHSVHDRQLHDILCCSKVVIAVFDPRQIMNKTGNWDSGVLDIFLGRAVESEIRGQHAESPWLTVIDEKPLSFENGDQFETHSIYLHQQFRISASPEVEDWIRSITAADARSVIPRSDAYGTELPRIKSIYDAMQAENNKAMYDADKSYDSGLPGGLGNIPYEIKVLDSPYAVVAAIDKKRGEMIERNKAYAKECHLSSAAGKPRDLCRVLATYDWPYTATRGGYVTLYPSRDAKGNVVWLMPGSWKKDGNLPIPPEGFSGENRFNMAWNAGAKLTINFHGLVGEEGSETGKEITKDLGFYGGKVPFNMFAKCIKQDKIQKTEGKVFIGWSEKENGVPILPDVVFPDTDYAVDSCNYDVYPVYVDASSGVKPIDYHHSARKDDNTDKVNDKDPWASRKNTESEIGSYFTIQGSDLNYAGVIIGPSISYDSERKCLIYRPQYSKDKNVNTGKSRNGTERDRLLAEMFVKNQLNVLLTRGVHGLYLFAVDPLLQHALMEAQQSKCRDSYRIDA